MNLLGSFNITTPVYVLNILGGLYEAFVIVVSGTNTSGVTTAKTAVGNIIFRRNGSDYQNINLGYLQNFNNAEQGYPQFTSSTGSTFYMNAHLPAKAVYDEKTNAYSLAPNEAQIQINLDSAFYGANGLASGTVYIYGIPTLVPERYRKHLTPFNQALAANNVIVADNNQPNITAAYFDVPADFSQIQIEQSGKLKCQAPGTVLRDETQYRAKIESAVTFCIVDLAKGWNDNNLGSVISDKFHLQATAASSVSGTSAAILVESISFNQASSADSVATITAQNLQAIQKNPVAGSVTSLVSTPPVSQNQGFSVAQLAD